MKNIKPLAAACALLLCAAAAAANDFPTAERVIYVQECMKSHPGPHFEMINKCSCAIDALAREVKYDDYVTMSTIVNAMSIGGERGNNLRDNEPLKPQVKRFRDLQAQAQKSCFITPR
jgi:hypothetical protein